MQQLSSSMEREKRGANFTKSEIDLLIDIALKYKHIIENKRTDATWKDKNEVWDKICDEFNAASGNFPRSTKTIRSKYDTIKKHIRKKCSLLKSEQTKTGGGQCTVTLTFNEEKLLSLTPNTMVGLKSRFDNDSQVGTSDSKRWMTRLQHDAEKENEPESCVMEEEIEFVDDGDNSLPWFSTRIEDMEVSNAVLINPEKSVNTKNTQMKRQIDAVDSVNEKTQRDAKFIFKNRRFKPSRKSEITQDMHLKNEVLMLQKELLLQEIKTKSDISELTIENLKLDTQIKRLTLQKLEANVIDIDYN